MIQELIKQEPFPLPSLRSVLTCKSQNSRFNLRDLRHGREILPRILCLSKNPVGKGLAKSRSMNTGIPSLMSLLDNCNRTWSRRLTHQSLQCLEAPPLFLGLSYTQGNRRLLNPEISGVPLFEAKGRQTTFDWDGLLNTTQTQVPTGRR